MTRPVANPAAHDRHAPLASLPPAEHGAPAPARGHYYAPDPIETSCPGCVLELTERGWQHERSCVFRRRAG